MRKIPENILVIDRRATARVGRIVLAMNALEAKGKLGRRYKALEAELDRLLSGQHIAKSGATISVPRA